MSILKRVLTEALASPFRKPVDGIAQDRRAEGTGQSDRSPQQINPPISSPPSARGRKVVILNWKRGENDPFSVVTATVKEHFRACGKNVEVIEISDGNWIAGLSELLPSVEFALTWQGLGSSVTVGEGRESLWEHFKIPLICIHGDHPSHMPLNHELDSRYCFHLYTNAEFARYSNRHFRRIHSASVIDIPQLHREPRLQVRAGDHFVVAKNITDPLDTERRWRQQLDKTAFDAYMMAAETLKSRFAREPYVEIHDALDELIVQHDLTWLGPATNLNGFHRYHSELDHYLRSYKGVVALTAVRDFPVHVYGRGWDRVAQGASASHTFLPGRNMADSQDLYYTRFGLIDISPAKGLHDRTRRAMANGGAFLSSANLEDSFSDVALFDSLFFSFMPQDLPEKCAAAVREPEYHLQLSRSFAELYHSRFHFKAFVNQIDLHAKMVNPL